MERRLSSSNPQHFLLTEMPIFEGTAINSEPSGQLAEVMIPRTWFEVAPYSAEKYSLSLPSGGSLTCFPDLQLTSVSASLGREEHGGPA